MPACLPIHAHLGALVVMMLISNWFALFVLRQSFFDPAEMDRLICGENSPWSIEDLRDSCKADHGYTLDSPAVQVRLSAVVCLSRSVFLPVRSH